MSCKDLFNQANIHPKIGKKCSMSLIESLKTIQSLPNKITKTSQKANALTCQKNESFKVNLT